MLACLGIEIGLLERVAVDDHGDEPGVEHTMPEGLVAPVHHAIQEALLVEAEARPRWLGNRDVPGRLQAGGGSLHVFPPFLGLEVEVSLTEGQELSEGGDLQDFMKGVLRRPASGTRSRGPPCWRPGRRRAPPKNG